MDHPLINQDCPQDRPPAIYELNVLGEAADEVSARLHEQTSHRPDMLSALVQLAQTDLNKSFWNVLLNPVPVWWSHLAALVLTLMTIYFWEIRFDTTTCFCNTGKIPPIQ